MSDLATMHDLPALARVSEKLQAVVCTTCHWSSKEAGTPSLKEAPLGEDMFPTWRFLGLYTFILKQFRTCLLSPDGLGTAMNPLIFTPMAAEGWMGPAMCPLLTSLAKLSIILGMSTFGTE